MNAYVDQASTKTISAEAAAGMVSSGMWLDLGGANAQPDLFDRALAARVAQLRDLRVRSVLTVRPLQVMEADPDGTHVQLYSWHFSGYDRVQHDAGRCNYIPLNLGEVPDYYRRFIDRPDIAVIRTSPMDEQGVFNFGLTNVWLGALLERAKVVIVETSPAIQFVHGSKNGVHISEVDYIIEGGDLGLTELNNPPATDIDRAVARQIASEVEDGSCIQVGIGGMPNAACALLAKSGVRDLGVHTEMLTDGIVDLVNAGCVTGDQKRLDPGKVVFTFGLGSNYMYEAVARNPIYQCEPVEYTNLPHIIMQNDKVVSINNTTQMDLQGQASSESDGHRHLTGTGGQLQFVRGAYASRGGKSFMLLSSTYERNGLRKSRIESPRVYRRLHFLRGWGYEKICEIRTGSSGTGGSDGA